MSIPLLVKCKHVNKAPDIIILRFNQCQLVVLVSMSFVYQTMPYIKYIVGITTDSRWQQYEIKAIPRAHRSNSGGHDQMQQDLPLHSYLLTDSFLVCSYKTFSNVYVRTNRVVKVGREETLSPALCTVVLSGNKSVHIRCRIENFLSALKALC